MNMVPLDDTVLATLTEPRNVVAITDASGKVRGFFAPIGLDRSADYAAAAAVFYPTKDVRPEGGKKFTTAEVLEHLESLGNG